MMRLRNFIRPRKVFALLTIIYLCAYFSHALYLGKTVYGDGMYYFSWLRTLVVDRDIEFSAEYRNFGLTRPDGSGNFHKNIYSIGPAMLWSLTYAPAYQAFGGSGFEFGYEMLVGLTSLIYALIGLVLLYRLLLKAFSQEIALLSIIAMACSTNLLFYGSVDPVNSHALTFFAAIVFLSFVGQTNSFNSLLLGISYGLLGLIRPQDLIYGIYFLLLPLRAMVMKWWKILLGIMLALLPQAMLWHLQHGKFYQSPYFAENALYFIPFQPKIMEVLFATKNGLFLLTPVTAIGAAGLIVKLWKKLSADYLLHLFILLLQLYVVSIRNEWWQEASFSGRMFVSIIPQFSIGTAVIIQILEKYDSVSKLILPTILGLTLLNVSLMIWYLITN